MVKKALITGITGQDGSYLAELLLYKGYQVHGVIRRSSSFNTGRIDHIYVDPHKKNVRLFLHYGDVSISEQFSNIIYNVKPDEVYHLAAQSHVKVSFDNPGYTGDITALGTTRILEEIKNSGRNIRFYQASSSEMFGDSLPKQSERTRFEPKSPYACAKLYAYWMTRCYRQAYGIFASNGILFNHESPRRGQTFVSRKIAHGIVSILTKKEKYIHLGNLDARRDWGFAPEYVEGMWKIIQLDKPGDFVLGTGESYSVKEFVQEAFTYVGLNWKKYIRIDPRYYRPSEVENLVADTRLAKNKIGWNPKVKFKNLVWIMLDAEMRAFGLTPIGEGDCFLRKNFPKRWWRGD
jgi:GDPmannose 4,6-dehydratase